MGIRAARTVSLLSAFILGGACLIGADARVMASAYRVLASEGPAAGVPVVINEFMASNSSFLQDPQGQYDDWLELYNMGDEPVDVAGMYLTDDRSESRLWRIPGGDPSLTTIGPKGFLLIWADGDGEDPGLHAGFGLRAGGDEIHLFDSDGITLIDSISFGPQYVDLSYGRYPDGSGELRLMVLPTPGEENLGLDSGVVAEPQFSRARGFYDGAFTLELSTSTEGATIHYTLDGRDPLDRSGRGLGGKEYAEPIGISGTTCVRAIATKAGWLSSRTVSATYIFLDQVIRQSARPQGFPDRWGGRAADYAMDQRVVEDPAYRSEIKDDLKSIPSVCIVIPNDDFFGSGGIYANPTVTGPQSERAASVEWIDPSTGGHFSVNAGLRIHGGPYSRSQNPKNALRVIFRGEYGLSRLEYPLFPDTEVRSFNTLALRSIWNYSWTGHSGMSGARHADYLRDVFARDTMRDMGGFTPHGRPVNVYINGLYWGLYIMTERPDECFVADHLGGDEDDYDILEAPSGMGASTVMEIIAGGQQAVEAWNALFELAAADLASPQAYRAIQARVDIPAMIDYMLMIYYTGSRDAPVFLGDSYTPRNFYAVRHRDPAGPFTFVPWDVEWALEEPTRNRVNVVGVWNPHYLMDRLAANPDFRVLLADRIYRHYYHDGALTRERATQRYTDRADEIRGAIVGESARWGDNARPSQPYTRADWETEVNRLVTQYFATRTETVMGQLRATGWYPSLAPPEFLVNGVPQRGGRIDDSDVVTLGGTGGTIWYTLDGSDPRRAGAGADPGEQLVLIPAEAAKRVLVPAGPVDAAWRGGGAFDDSAWIAGTGGVGFEISTGYEQFFRIDVRGRMYGTNASCYIRIPFDLTADGLEGVSSLLLKVRYDDGFVAYLNGTEVQRALFDGEPRWNSAATANHNDLEAINFEAFDISAHAGALRLGRNVLAIHGLNAGTTSSDFLISVELIAAKGAAAGLPGGVSPTALRYQTPLELDASTCVKVRALGGDTWSALNEATFAVGPVAESLRISEIMYHPADTGDPNDPDTEYIELTNIGAEAINLNLVRFTDGIEFAFPGVNLTPGGYCLVVKDPAAFEARYSPGLPVVGQYTGSLSNAGEQIELRDAAGTVIHRFAYEDNWHKSTDGLGFSLVLRDPLTADPDAFGDQSLWRPSSRPGGSPGTSDNR